jgi:hypothetical protein
MGPRQQGEHNYLVGSASHDLKQQRTATPWFGNKANVSRININPVILHNIFFR